MVQECAYLYDDGRNCRRIPARGHLLCPGHERRAEIRRLEAQIAEKKAMAAWNRYLESLSLERLLATLGESLAAIHSTVLRRSSRANQLAFARALLANSISLQRIVETLEGLHQVAARYPWPPPSPPENTPSISKTNG